MVVGKIRIIYRLGNTQARFRVALCPPETQRGDVERPLAKRKNECGLSSLRKRSASSRQQKLGWRDTPPSLHPQKLGSHIFQQTFIEHLLLLMLGTVLGAANTAESKTKTLPYGACILVRGS